MSFSSLGIQLSFPELRRCSQSFKRIASEGNALRKSSVHCEGLSDEPFLKNARGKKASM
jgi:hypothetical protein